MPEIGETLRETRMRRRIDMTEVEAATKIRAKYLRALENEEWDLLPGPTFVKTFLRTYAEYLELDPRLLVEEYRQRYERPSTQDLTPFARGAGGQRAARAASGRARLGPALVGRARRRACCSARSTLLGTLGRRRRRRRARRRPRADADADGHAGQEAPRSRRSPRRRRASRCSSSPTGPVYVCLVDADRQDADQRRRTCRPGNSTKTLPLASASA